MQETIKENKGLLDDIENIIRLSKLHNLENEFFEQARQYLEPLASLLKITELQAALLSLVLEYADDEAVSVGDIAKIINCSRMQALGYLDDFQRLEQKGLLREGGSDPRPRGWGGRPSNQIPAYYVPLDVINAIRTGRTYRDRRNRNLSAEDFFKTALQMFMFQKESDRSIQAFVDEIKSLFNANVKCAFVRGVLSCNIRNFESVIDLLAFCCAWIESEDEDIAMSALSPMFPYTHIGRLETKFKKGVHQLVRDGLITNGNDCGMADTETWTLTQKAREIFLADIDIKEKKLKSSKNLIEAVAIPERILFYSENVRRRITELTMLLAEEQFSVIKKRLAEQNMSAAFTVLFQGPPGTGKTESAYQIARLTDRDMYLVDISDTKSKWFGESEKQIKAIFDRYQKMIKKGGLTPILLFNEADAVLGKRQELSDTSRGPAQTENTIQNIILQEMENLHGGILFATTNMIVNLDKAFERRFLYKIEFEKPDRIAKTAIWQNRLPDISLDDAAVLSSHYDFSGGQIDNIIRKQAISSILHGSSANLEGLSALCEDELMEKAAKQIGFAAS